MTTSSTTAPAAVPTATAADEREPVRQLVALPTMIGEQRGRRDAELADREVDDAARPVDEHDAHRHDGDDQPVDQARRTPGLRSRCAAARATLSISRPRCRRTLLGRGRRAGAARPRVPSNAPHPSRGRSRGRRSPSATLSDCSTISIVWPRASQRVDELEQPLHDDGCESERQLVDQQDLGFVDQHARECEHLLLAARQAAGRLRRASRRARGTVRAPRRCARRLRRWFRRASRALIARFWSTVRLGNTPLPPGSWTMPNFARVLGGART